MDEREIWHETMRKLDEEEATKRKAAAFDALRDEGRKCQNDFIDSFVLHFEWDIDENFLQAVERDLMGKEE